jgi:hypothetical protein
MYAKMERADSGNKKMAKARNGLGGGQSRERSKK